jgi:tetratricopeptide (TPR) repeat protein
VPARRHRVAAVLALVFVAGSAVVLWQRAQRPVPTPDRLRVLVAAPSAADPSVGTFADVSRSAILRALGQIPNLQLAEGSAGAGAAALREARAARAGLTVTSTVYAHGSDSVRIESRLLDVQSGNLVRAFRPVAIPRTASDGDWSAALDPLLSTVSIASFPWLGPHALPLREPRHAASRELLTALSLGTRPDSAARATMLLRTRRASELDSAFLQARLWSGAMHALVYTPAYSPGTRAYLDSVIAYVDPLRAQLAPFEVTLLDYVAASRRGDQGLVLAALQRMREIVPDALLARALPQVLLDLNRPREALRLLKSAQPTREVDGRLVEPAASPFYWSTIADVQHYLGDYVAARAAAQRVRQLRPDFIGSVRYQVNAAAALGDSVAVDSLLAAARSMPGQMSEYEFFGDLALQAARELEAHGHAELGRETGRRATQWFDARSPREMEWPLRQRHALALHELGDPRRALAVLEPLRSTDSSGVAIDGLHGRLSAALGDTAEALRVDSALASLGTRVGGSNTLERAFIAANLGRREQAVARLQEAFSQGVGFSIRWRLHSFTDLRSLRGYPPFVKLLEPQG